MNRSSVAALAIFFGLTSVLVACSSAQEEKDPCEKNPKGRGCGTAPATTGTTYDTPIATPPAPLPVAVDAGPAPNKPEAGPYEPPENNVACADLLRCCWNIQDTIERAACMAIGYKGSQSSCTTGLVTYAVFGCGHTPINPGGGSNTCSGYSSSTKYNGQNDYQCCMAYQSGGYDQTACCGYDNAGCAEW